MKKIIITTGGTGGHIFPAESIAKGLVDAGYEVYFITDKRGAEYRKLTEIPTHIISAASVTGQSFFGKIRAMFKLIVGLYQSAWFMMRQKPDLVIGVGGYASLPAVLAAQVLRIPTAVHEQNAVLGRANRLLAQKVKFVATAFAETKRVPTGISTFLVGQPVRPAIQEKQNSPYPMDSVFNLLIFGGSQGARFLSRELPKALLKLPENIRANLKITQQARPEDVDELQKMYQNAGFYGTTVQSFFDNMPDLLVKSNLVIGRAGSSTLAELAVIGRPGIYVPLPTSADNHQFENARQFAEAGAGWLIQEKDFDVDAFTKRLEELIMNPDELIGAAKIAASLGHPDVAEQMVRLIEQGAFQK
ncbi:MAG: undecaprenyldiphospho-muramoylpentapeptide beta-N-acetylglucosaminyltransferase [Alphaproteobacteria bacterium]|nr:undecaprenyldiphospho-muramoylpentapeptide beta-N-acetylglucosaminyltransferase [Alphaproteobacteria bacterium]